MYRQQDHHFTPGSPICGRPPSSPLVPSHFSSSSSSSTSSSTTQHFSSPPLLPRDSGCHSPVQPPQISQHLVQPYNALSWHFTGPLVPGQLVPRRPLPILTPAHPRYPLFDTSASSPFRLLQDNNIQSSISYPQEVYQTPRPSFFPCRPSNPGHPPSLACFPPSAYRSLPIPPSASVAAPQRLSPSLQDFSGVGVGAAVVFPPPPPMSSSSAFGGLAALQSQLLPSSSATSSGGPSSYYGQRQGPAPTSSVSPPYPDQRRESSNSTSSASQPPPLTRGSAGSTASTSGVSTSPSTALTSPNDSFDHHKSVSQRSSADSYSRASQTAFAYADQLKSPNLGMNGPFPGPSASDTNPSSDAGKQASSADGDVAGFMNRDIESAENSPVKAKGLKKSNPLQDLIETETAYVAELGKIIRKVAAAWSRANFPPPELDTMFRNVEAIYRINRTFLKSLKDIGPSPSSPRALGDLLMRWIDDLETPYTRYCENYFADFDGWHGVQSNAKLADLLVEISSTTNADGTPVTFSDRKRSAGDLWTLDTLFALPQTRLRYYKKLYSRLLKSTNPGRSDHRLLVGANDKLDELLEKSMKKISMGILDDSPTAAKDRAERVAGEKAKLSQQTRTEAQGTGMTSVPSISSPALAPSQPVKSLATNLGKLDFSNTPLANLDVPQTPGANDLPLSPILVGQQARPPPLMTVTASGSSPSLQSENVSPIGNASADELERMLNVDRVLDIFTMKPKKCQLRINPPTLPFKRDLRKSADVIIDFVPLSTGQEVSWRKGHIFLLTDLFLVCDRMTPSERQEKSLGPDGMWLLFPPLAGKHLKVVDPAGAGNTLLITILKKETLKVHMGSKEEKEAWLSAFEECYNFACSIGPKSPSLISSNTSSPGPSPLGGAPIQANAPPARGLGLSPILSPAIGGSLGSGPPLPGGWPNFSRTSSSQDTHLGQSRSAFDRPATSTSIASPPKNGRPGSANGRPLEALPGPRGMPLSSANLGRVTSSSSRSENLSVDGDSIFGRPFMGGPPLKQNPVRPSPPVRSNTNGPFPPPLPPGGAKPYPQQGGPGPNGSYMRPLLATPVKSNSFYEGATGSPGLDPSPIGHRSETPLSVASGRASPFTAGSGPRGQGGALSPFSRPHPPSVPTNLSSALQNRGEPLRRPSAPNLREQTRSPMGGPARTRSASSSKSNGAPKLPSEMMKDGDLRGTPEYSPPSSPKLQATGPTTSTVSAQMRCRLYLKQGHAQWKSLGNARLKLYHLLPADQRQLVVENDRKTLVSTIILPDGVERVGKVGVAVEISDAGKHTGIIYMLQMRSEESAQGLFGELIDGSGRTIAV